MVSQPEMTELYLATADLEIERQNYDAALKNVDTVLELTNDDPLYIRKKIAVFLKKPDAIQKHWPSRRNCHRKAGPRI